MSQLSHLGNNQRLYASECTIFVTITAELILTGKTN